MGKYDIVIVGGGFAGASLAYKLSKLNGSLEIALVERSGIGCKPVSAFTFTDVVEGLGLRNSVRQYYNQIEIISTLGARESYTYDSDVFAFIDYRKACEELVKRSGCHVMLEEVSSLKGGNIALKDEKIGRKIIVDASGRDYRFRKELGLDIPRIENHLYFKRLTHCSISNPKSVQLIVGDIGTNGGWFYPISECECEIGVAERTNKLSRVEKANISQRQKKNMERLLNHETYCGMLKDSRSESETMIYHPYEPVKQVVKDNVVFLGDNSGMVHPLHGMGIHYINRIGSACANYCAQAATGDIKILKEYQNAWNSMLKKDINSWIWGMIYWNLDIEQLNRIIEIRSNSYVDKMNVLSELKGHTDNEGDVFQVPLDLYFSIVSKVLIYKIRYKLKYRL